MIGPIWDVMFRQIRGESFQHRFGHTDGNAHCAPFGNSISDGRMPSGSDRAETSRPAEGAGTDSVRAVGGVGGRAGNYLGEGAKGRIGWFGEVTGCLGFWVCMEMLAGGAPGCGPM